MRYGVCVDLNRPEEITAAKAAGFDYVECRFPVLANADDADIARYAETLHAAGIPCESANCLIPNTLPLLGSRFDAQAVAAHLDTGMRHGQTLGLQTVVLGSGGARNIPEGMDYRTAVRELGAVLGSVMAPVAAKYGITIVIEPLRSAECNFINTIKEGVMMAAISGQANVTGLCDLFHMVCESDTYDDIRALKGCIRHAHISFPLDHTDDGRPGRCYPRSAEEFDYSGFLRALEEAGCPRCSIEAHTDDFAHDAAIAGPLIKSL